MKHQKLNQKINKLCQERKKGFTIVEVTLATAFVAMLLISITIITTNIAAIFQKGLTLRAVNNVGRNLISDLTSSINAAPSVDVTSLCKMYVSEGPGRDECLQDNAYKFLYQETVGLGRIENDILHHQVNEGDIQYSGVFCSGTYSYIWNTNYSEQVGDAASRSLTYRRPNGEERTLAGNEFKLIKFEDKTYRACSVNVNNQYAVSGNRDIDMRTLANGTAYTMADPQGNFLDDSEVPLDLYELVMFPVSLDSVTLRAFFSGTFILATMNHDVSLLRTGDYCDLSGELETDTASNLLDIGSQFNYCGINKFNFAARTAGSGI